MEESSWYKNAVVYQIYPRSFADSNGDGLGDIKGIINRLDYLSRLGVTAIWLSPIYKSPMVDFGYDVSDYEDIDPIFGNLADFDELVKQTHARGMKLIMDFIPSHTSDQHAWFKEARSDLNSPKRDWYTWRAPKPDGTPPNNWISVFGGSAWTLDQTTNQYYLHSFLSQQPDLNWFNPAVRNAIYNTMRVWFERGVDGLRVDAVNHLSKDPELKDNPRNVLYKPGVDDPAKELDSKFSMDGPDLQLWLHEMADTAKKFTNRCLFFEFNPHVRKYDPVEYLRYYELCDTSISAPFNFGLIFTPWTVASVKKYIDDFENGVPPEAFSSYVLGNHDRSRLASRVGPESARVAAVLLLTLPGAKFVYYGDEIGMENTDIPPDKIQDPFGRQVPGFSRDAQRTPMQWSAENNAGFSTGSPWLPINQDYKNRNVEAMLEDKSSILNLYRQLIGLRQQNQALGSGDYSPMESGRSDVFCFRRKSARQTVTVLLNFSHERVEMDISLSNSRLLLSSYLDLPQKDVEKITLRPYEAWILES